MRQQRAGIGGRDSDAQVLAFPFGEIPHFLLQLAVQKQNLIRALVQLFPGCRQCERACSLEQNDAQIRFHLRNVGAQGLLRNVKLLCRRRKTAGIGNHHEIAELQKADHSALSLFGLFKNTSASMENKNLGERRLLFPWPRQREETNCMIP